MAEIKKDKLSDKELKKRLFMCRSNCVSDWGAELLLTTEADAVYSIDKDFAGTVYALVFNNACRPSTVERRFQALHERDFAVVDHEIKSRIMSFSPGKAGKSREDSHLYCAIFNTLRCRDARTGLAHELQPDVRALERVSSLPEKRSNTPVDDGGSKRAKVSEAEPSADAFLNTPVDDGSSKRAKVSEAAPSADAFLASLGLAVQKDEMETENEVLREDNERLQIENERLRAVVTAASQTVTKDQIIAELLHTIETLKKQGELLQLDNRRINKEVGELQSKEYLVRSWAERKKLTLTQGLHMIRSYEEEKLMANVEGLTGELVKANKFTTDAVEETRLAHIKLKEKQDEFLQVRVRNEVFWRLMKLCGLEKVYEFMLSERGVGKRVKERLVLPDKIDDIPQIRWEKALRWINKDMGPLEDNMTRAEEVISKMELTMMELQLKTTSELLSTEVLCKHITKSDDLEKTNVAAMEQIHELRVENANVLVKNASLQRQVDAKTGAIEKFADDILRLEDTVALLNEQLVAKEAVAQE